MTYDPSGNAAGDRDALISCEARGLPDQFQGRYAHLVLKRTGIPENFFSMRQIKESSRLDDLFEAYRLRNPQVEDRLYAQAVDQVNTEGRTRGNFKSIWTSLRTEMFG